MKTCLIDAEIFIEKPELIEPLRALGEVTMYRGIPETLDEVVKRAGDADCIAFGLMQFTREMIDNLQNLKILQFIGTGMWNFVDVDYAESKGIKVLNIAGYGSNAVAEFAVGMAFALSRKISLGDYRMKNKVWSIEELKGLEIKNAKVGVVGTGSIGRLVAEKYLALGANVKACDIYENKELKEQGIQYVDMQEIFRDSDLITLHMIVTKETERSINKELFDLMKPNALLVNVARAELIDAEALSEALKNKTLGGAAIDVYNSEPPSVLDYELASLSNVVATPHIGYNTQEALDNSIVMTVSSILDALK